MKLVALLCSLFAITSNTINAILFRILLFLLRATYMCTLGASYIGLTYIIVYAGAIGILFIFVIRLLFPSIEQKRTKGQALTATPLALVLITLIWRTDNKFSNDPNSSEVSFMQAFNPNMIDNIALYLYAPNAIWIRILAIRFLVARVGSIVLCLRDNLHHAYLKG